MNEITTGGETAGTTPNKRTAGAVGVLVAMLIATFAAVGLSSSTASASAFSCAGFQAIGTPWGTASANSYCVTTSGSGTWVNYVGGSFTANIGTVCNYNITAEFFDSQGRWYMTKQTPVRYGCWWGTQAAGRVTINQTVRRGSVCSTLKQNGQRLTSVCHNIY